jgi:hypothetical protein
MQLAEFILKNIEPIAQEWEEFARTCTPGAIGINKGALLADTTQILDAVVDDMEQPRTQVQQATKGKSQRSSGSLIDAALSHIGLRIESRFDLDRYFRNTALCALQHRI